MKKPVFTKKVKKIAVEDRFAYLSDEDSDDNKDDEDWSPSKKVQTNKSTSSRKYQIEGSFFFFFLFIFLFLLSSIPGMQFNQCIFSFNQLNHRIRGRSSDFYLQSKNN